MFQKLKEALMGVNEEASSAQHVTDPVKLACAALLARAAWLDGLLDAKEEKALISLMVERFSLDEIEAKNIVSEATVDVKISNVIYIYT